MEKTADQPGITIGTDAGTTQPFDRGGVVMLYPPHHQFRSDNEKPYSAADPGQRCCTCKNGRLSKACHESITDQATYSKPLVRFGGFIGNLR
jgi:hypothetical protein